MTTDTRMAWLNGDFVAEGDARVSIFDRGLLFGDGVYDVVTVLEGRLVDAEYHLARLDRSCRMIELANPLSIDAWRVVLEELLVRTGVREGLTYVQVTRGTAERDFAFPAGVRPTAFAYARGKVLLDDPHVRGVEVVTVPDLRWKRCDIKATSLLAPVLAKQEARRRGAFEAFMHDDGVVTEGGSSNAFIVRGGTVVTRALTAAILPGVTRHVVLELAAGAGYVCEERPFTVAEMLAADEVFLSSATTFVLPVVRVDGVDVGGGVPGPVALRLRELYVERALRMVRGG